MAEATQGGETKTVDVLNLTPSALDERRYRELRDRGLEATRLGRLQEASESFSAAAEAAERLDEVVQDRSFCNVALIEIELGSPVDTLIPRLRGMLTKNADDENCRLAAYHLARIYDLRKEYKKALFYSRVAAERSQRCAREDWIASSRNQAGSLLLAESRFDEAETELTAAFAMQPPDDAVRKALILDNLGYCHVVQGRFEAGFRCLFDGLRMIRRLDAPGWAHQFHLTLCFSYLEIDRWRRAARHGLRAFDLAERHGDADATKNALFLLGETANLAGDADSAYAYFSRLQERFFPQHEFLPDFLLAVDVRGLVNLKA